MLCPSDALFALDSGVRRHDEQEREGIKPSACIDIQGSGKSAATSAFDEQRRPTWPCTQQWRGRYVEWQRRMRCCRGKLHRRQDEWCVEPHRRHVREQYAITAARGGIVRMLRHPMPICMRSMQGAAGVDAGRHAVHRHIHRHGARNDRHQHDQRHGGQSQPCHKTMLCGTFRHACMTPADEPRCAEA